MILRIRARWIIPVISAPIEGGEITVENGKIVTLGKAAETTRDRWDLVDLGDSILFPAPVNAHTHLEWSFLEGRSPAGGPFTAWVRSLLSIPRPREGEVLRAASRAARAIASEGTRLVGNFSASLADVTVMTDAGLRGAVFHELVGLPAEAATSLLRSTIGRTSSRSEDLDLFPSPHGPHTVSREMLMLLARRLTSPGERLAIHVAESVEETEFLMTGRGPFREIHEMRGGWDGSWTPPRLTPVRYLESLGMLTPRTVAVHCVHIDDAETELLARRGASIVLCPRSNLRTGAGLAPLERLRRAGVICALGTDSLASNTDLWMSAELAAARRAWPSVSPAALVEMATSGGARAVGLEGTCGVIAPGMRTWLAAAAIPAGAAGSSEPCAILCGDLGEVSFRAVETGRPS